MSFTKSFVFGRPDWTSSKELTLRFPYSGSRLETKLLKPNSLFVPTAERGLETTERNVFVGLPSSGTHFVRRLFLMTENFDNIDTSDVINVKFVSTESIVSYSHLDWYFYPPVKHVTMYADKATQTNEESGQTEVSTSSTKPSPTRDPELDYKVECFTGPILAHPMAQVIKLVFQSHTTRNLTLGNLWITLVINSLLSQTEKRFNPENVNLTYTESMAKAIKTVLFSHKLYEIEAFACDTKEEHRCLLGFCFLTWCQKHQHSDYKGESVLKMLVIYLCRLIDVEFTYYTKGQFHETIRWLGPCLSIMKISDCLNDALKLMPTKLTDDQEFTDKLISLPSFKNLTLEDDDQETDSESESDDDVEPFNLDNFNFESLNS